MIKLSNPHKQDNSLWLKVKHTHMSGSDVKYLYLGKLIFLGISDFSLTINLRKSIIKVKS